MSRPPKLIVGAVIARCPRAFAGHHCSIMNWALGFRELGWDVWITEHLVDEEMEAPVAPGRKSIQEEFWHDTAREFGFENRQCLIVNGASPDLEAFRDFAADAELFLNYSGQFKRLDLLGARTVKAYLDVDPGYTQIWSEGFGSDMNFDGHDVFFTVGTTLTDPGALLPTVGRDWIPTLLPVVADYWRGRVGEIVEPAASGAWTTIAHWYGYPELEWQGRKYGGKRESLMEMLALPGQVRRPCVIATDLAPDWDDYGVFDRAGWKFVASKKVSNDIPTYLRFIAESHGEIGIAKAGYVTSRGGWMSDRSVVYSALGKPVVMQDTGWTKALEPRPGLLAFHDVASAAKAMAEVEGDYARHAAGARELAETVHAPGAIITPLVERIL